MSRQVERELDAFLDGLILGSGDGQAAARHEIDPGLMETARRVQALASAPDVSTPPASTLAAIWEDVMGNQSNASVADSPRRPSLRPSGFAPPLVAQRGGERSERRPRWPVTALSFAAMLLLLLGLGAVAYRLGPGAPTSEPPSMPAGFLAGSPATTLPTEFTEFIEPRPATCQVTPRTMEETQALSAAPDAFAPIDIVSPASPDGPPADPATIDAIIATLRELYVCLEIGDEPRAHALLTDDALAMDPSLQTLGPREAFRIVEATLLPDGRVVATIAFRVSEGVFRETWIFIEHGDRYLVGAVLPPGADVPDPSECQVEPRTVEEIAAMFATPSSTASNRLLIEVDPPITIEGGDERAGTPQANEPPLSGAITPPPVLANERATIQARTGTPGDTFAVVPAPLDGPAADPATVVAVSATWREYIACLNAGDYFRVIALFSHAGFRRTFVQGDPLPNAETIAGAPRGPSLPMAERIPFLPLSEVRVLSDGRVVATVEASESSGMALESGQVIFVKEGDRWLIDELAVLIE